MSSDDSMNIPDWTPWVVELNGHIELLHFANGTSEEYVPYMAAKQMIAKLYERIAVLEGNKESTMSAPIGQVYNAITRERQYQELKRPGKQHSVPAWLLIMRKELEEAEQAWVECDGDSAALLEILQVAAVAVACMEQHGITERKWD